MKTYLSSVIKQMEYNKMLGEKTIDQVPADKLYWQPDESCNSIGMLAKHLHGNMLSRWTDFLTTDGEKPNRIRDEEFEPEAQTKEELLENWGEGWSCLLDTLRSLTDDDLSKTVYIRNMGQTVIEAINRQVAHYSYHTGQIVFIGTLIMKKDWVSLSIPKGDSEKYNEEKFADPKRQQHFTDDLLK